MEKLNLNQNPTLSETETNNETSYSMGDIKRAMLNAREIREYSDEVAARISGPPGQALDKISERTFNEADRLYEENSDWVNSKIEQICEQFPNFEQDKLKDSFLNGLRLHIKRIYRTYKKDSPGNLNDFDDRQYVRDSIAAYTAEYIMLLRQAQRTTESPNMALAIAEKSHLLTVSDYKKLINKYNDLGYGTINTAATSYPSNPEKFLDGVIETVARLKENEKYAGLGDGAINAAAISYPSDPEKFLDGVIETVARLKENEKYAGLGDGAINAAATGYPSNPEKFLDGVVETVARLKTDERYAGLGDREINRAAISNSGNPEKFLDGVIETVARLKENEKYAGLGDWEINRAAIGHPSNPEKFLDGVVETVARLKTDERYAGLGNRAINMAAIEYPSNPEKYLDNLLNKSGR
jgi:hypothetical protein